MTNTTETPASPRRTSSWLDLTLLCRSVGIAISGSRLLLAFIGVVATVLLGFALDAVWPAGASPTSIVRDGYFINEVELYSRSAGAAETHAMVEDAAKAGAATVTNGVFELLLLRVRLIEDRLIAAVWGLSPGQLWMAGRDALTTLAWLVSMHWFFAILFGIGATAIWGYCGSGIARGVALAIARNDPLPINDYFAVCRAKFVDTAIVPILPVIVSLIAAVALWLMGFVGAIPFIGDVLVGLGFPLVFLFGAVIACAMTIVAAAVPMAPFGIVANDEDPLDALTNAGHYVVERPVRIIACYLIALVIGILAFGALKWLVAFSLWCGGSALSVTMDLGSPSLANATTTAPKLESIWIPPNIGADVAFYGTFPDAKLAGGSWIARGLIRFWIMIGWAMLAAFAVSFAYASAGIAWFLLRSDVDRTDITEVADEIADKQSESAPGSA